MFTSNSFVLNPILAFFVVDSSSSGPEDFRDRCTADSGINKRKKRNFGHGFNKIYKRRDDNGPYPDSGVNKRKKRKEGNP